jgi:hypothetical protein
MCYFCSFHFYYNIFIMDSTILLVGASDSSSSLEHEAEALLESGWWHWWSLNRKNASSHCKWPGISCNKKGSVTEIKPPRNFTVGEKFGTLNFLPSQTS